MSQISKNVKLLYCEGEKLTVGTLIQFARELNTPDISEELTVSIEKTGLAFTIEGYIEEA